MTAVAIHDMTLNRALDVRAMSAIRGARSGLWALGAFVPFRPARPAGFVVNFHQTNNIFVADQMNIQLQTITIKNTGANADISLDAAQNAINVDFEIAA